MNKKEIIEIIETCKWSITVMVIWFFIFILGTLCLWYISSKNILIDNANIKFYELEKRFNNHAHFFQNGKATYIK